MTLPLILIVLTSAALIWTVSSFVKKPKFEPALLKLLFGTFGLILSIYTTGDIFSLFSACFSMAVLIFGAVDLIALKLTSDVTSENE